MTELSGLDDSNTRAEDINALGQITGKRRYPDGQDCAFLWEAGTVTDLGPIQDGVSSQAIGMSDTGYITGVGNVPPPEGGVCWHGFVWHEGTMIGLGEGTAYNANAQGQVVGTLSGKGFVDGFLWQNGVAYDLNTLAIDLGPENHIRSGTDINNHGVILADAESSHAGIAIVLTPIDRPLTDLDYDCRTDMHDLLILLDEWGETDSDADFNGDGLVGPGDLAILLGTWG